MSAEPETAPPVDVAALRAALDSVTLRGAAAMAAAFVAAKFGVMLPDGWTQYIADAAIQVIFYLGLLAVGVGRTRAKGPLA